MDSKQIRFSVIVFLLFSVIGFILGWKKQLKKSKNSQNKNK